MHGACRVLALYWEMIPPSTAKGLLTALVKDLAHDASANTVRVAALQGLNYLLVQNGSLEVATALKASLPRRPPLLRDGSERVRVALLELLLAAPSSSPASSIGRVRSRPRRCCASCRGRSGRRCRCG